MVDLMLFSFQNTHVKRARIFGGCENHFEVIRIGFCALIPKLPLNLGIEYLTVSIYNLLGCREPFKRE